MNYLYQKSTMASCKQFWSCAQWWNGTTWAVVDRFVCTSDHHRPYRSVAVVKMASTGFLGEDNRVLVYKSSILRFLSLTCSNIFELLIRIITKLNIFKSHYFQWMNYLLSFVLSWCDKVFLLYGQWISQCLSYSASRIALATSSTRMAEIALVSVSEGRGASLPLLMAEQNTRFGGLVRLLLIMNVHHNFINVTLF